jgi:hypothetical protein
MQYQSSIDSPPPGQLDGATAQFVDTIKQLRSK